MADNVLLQGRQPDSPAQQALHSAACHGQTLGSGVRCGNEASQLHEAHATSIQTFPAGTWPPSGGSPVVSTSQGGSGDFSQRRQPVVTQPSPDVSRQRQMLSHTARKPPVRRPVRRPHRQRTRRRPHPKPHGRLHPKPHPRPVRKPTRRRPAPRPTRRKPAARPHVRPHAVPRPVRRPARRPTIQRRKPPTPRRRPAKPPTRRPVAQRRPPAPRPARPLPRPPPKHPPPPQPPPRRLTAPPPPSPPAGPQVPSLCRSVALAQNCRVCQASPAASAASAGYNDSEHILHHRLQVIVIPKAAGTAPRTMGVNAGHANVVRPLFSPAVV